MLTQRQLRKIIHYDHRTGIATWMVNAGGRARIGTRVGFIQRGSKRSQPYRYVKFKAMIGDCRKPFTHLVHFYMTGKWPVAEIDHIDHDTLNDRWRNLRESTRSQNEANRGVRRNSKSGFKGVYLQKGRYVAAIWRDGRRDYLGGHDTPELAAAAYDTAAKQADGQFFHPQT